MLLLKHVRDIAPVCPNMFSFPTGRYFNSSAPGRSICRWRIPAVFRSMPSSSMWRCLPWCLSRWNIWLVSARSHAGRSMAILGHGLGRCWIFWRFRMMGWSWFVTWSLHFWWGFSSRHRGWCKRNPHTDLPGVHRRRHGVPHPHITAIVCGWYLFICPFSFLLYFSLGQLSLLLAAFWS